MTSSHYDYTSAVISKSKNGFQNGSWGNPYDYIVIGMQQWGYESSFNGGDKLSFPISFSNTTYTITGSSWDSSQIYCPKFTNKTTTQCTMHNGIGYVSYNGNSALDWVAIGIQQWGYYEAASTLTVTLPIAFTTTDYAITLSPKTKSDAFGHRWKDKTLVSFGVDRISGVSTPGNYHAIGW